MNMVILDQEGAVAPAKVKKKTQGRKKIEIKKIESLSNRQVTFSKRRVGLFKKASELCLLTGAGVAIIVHSLGKRVFTFGHPTPDAVVERFLSGGGGGECAAGENIPAAAEGGDFNKHYSDVCKELEAEKKRKEAVEEGKRVEAYGGGGLGYWWDEAVDGLEVEELEVYSAAMEELMKNVIMRADDLMLIQNCAALSAPGPHCADDMTVAMVNQGLVCGGASVDYGNCNMVAFGFGMGEQL